MEEVHDQLALVGLEVEVELDELVEELMELTLHTWLVVPLLDFFSKGFLLHASFVIAIGDGST